MLSKIPECRRILLTVLERSKYPQEHIFSKAKTSHDAAKEKAKSQQPETVAAEYCVYEERELRHQGTDKANPTELHQSAGEATAQNQTHAKRTQFWKTPQDTRYSRRAQENLLHQTIWTQIR